MNVSLSKETELARLVTSPPEYVPEETQISITPGLAGWMLANSTSLAFTSYQTGQLILMGVAPDGRIAFNEQNYARATGLCWHEGGLYVGSMFQIWRLENMLRPGQYANNSYDCVLVPRAAQTVNYVDVHELGVDRNDRVIFVNSRYSCLAAFDATHSFRPLWKPPFISDLAPEDRCHLNGMAMVEGVPKYVTALAASDEKEGWRQARESGGIVMEVPSGQILADNLSMPHSPRLHDGSLWLLDSGRGQIVTIDPSSGRQQDVAFCPGFLRGLQFYRGFAIVTVSKARDGNFGSLPIQNKMEREKREPLCGVLIVDLARGEVMESVLFDGKISEMFDVALLPGIRNPMSIGPETVEMIGTVSVNPDFGPLAP
jgi:uncharacterized protein (TIGR03032 family)